MELVRVLGLQGASIPVLLPGAVRGLSLSPRMSAEDKRVVDNFARMITFFAGGPSDQHSSARFSLNPLNLLNNQQFRDVLPLLPTVGRQILPDLINRLSGRVIARTLREVFVL